jgi:23S rRNA (uridine2552-2'-O)-methyltransferase
MSKLHERSNRHDVFHQKARREGFAARSVFKLQEIDEKVRLFRGVRRVLDLGCRPGSWLQYAARMIGPGAALVGLDRTALDVVIPGARILIGDVFTIEPAELRGDLGGFDLVLSDMAPDTSGIRSLDQARSEALFARALDVADAVLVAGGAFLGKLFQGPELPDLLKRCRAAYDKVNVVKPKSSRSDSIEQYVVALGRRRSSS